MNEKQRERKIQEKKPALDEDDLLPVEKWLVAFENIPSNKNQDKFSFLRQFYAPGFYEAYDTVLSFAEKSKLNILWFKEKKNCGDKYLNSDFPLLETVCTYCNKAFNDIDPIPCKLSECYAEFCSNACMIDHFDLKHKGYNSLIY
ncbi:MAG TPA: hypothetical protein VI033_01135 [Candidatus Nitrosopolaris sp.]